MSKHDHYNGDDFDWKQQIPIVGIIAIVLLLVLGATSC